jgi:hypothetical protein
VIDPPKGTTSPVIVIDELVNEALGMALMPITPPIPMLIVAPDPVTVLGKYVVPVPTRI